ncbi:MAG: L-histidine N(alpha)-methyltransferase [Nannocystaceae bacterium]
MTNIPQSGTSNSTYPSNEPDNDYHETLTGLQRSPPRVSPKWFYDTLGSTLFESITRTPEYYGTRCEVEILQTQGEAIGKHLPVNLAVVEFGSGSAEKIGKLLPHLASPRVYHPIDISETALHATAAEIGSRFPDLSVDPHLGDFTNPAMTRRSLATVTASGPTLLFFPGSTLGNFEPEQAAELLTHTGASVPPGTPFLLGVDLIKDTAQLKAAYDDDAGVTAAFNRNMLVHLNRRFGADFDARRWRHEVKWNPAHRRIEMWLRSSGEQRVNFGGTHLEFADGDGIHTENSHKWDRASIEKLAASTGWRIGEWWTDERGWFAEILLTRCSHLRPVSHSSCRS